MKRMNFKRAKVLRQKGALERLEAAYNKFQAAKEDKIAKHGVIRSYDAECKRMSLEIKTLKERIASAV